MLISIRRGAVFLGIGLVILVCVAVIAESSSAQSEWTPNQQQLDRSTQILQRVATADDPSLGAAEAIKAAAMADTWPASVSSVKFVATDRQTALSLIGTPDAVPGDMRPVLLYLLSGTFVGRGTPRPQGASEPVSKFAQFVVDPASGTVLDFGYVDQDADLGSVGGGTSLLNRQ